MMMKTKMKPANTTIPSAILRRSAVLAVLLCSAGMLRADAPVSAAGGTPSPVQAADDPLGLPLAGKVMQAGSDAASAQFDKSTLPAALAFIQANLPDGHNNTGNQAVFSVDPSKLTLANTTDLRAYFVSESAGFNSTLGFNTTGIGVSGGSPQIIFPEVSSPEDFNPNPADSYGARSASQPLLPGDFVNLGTQAAGAKLNFFLIANGANNGGNTDWVFNSGGAAANPDDFNHSAAFTPSVFAIPQLDSPYLFITFKDWWGGGDQDYNDAIIAINVGSANIHAMVAAPEPPLALTLGGCLGLAWWAKRHRSRAEQNQPQA